MLYFLHTKLGNISYFLFKKLLESSSDGHVTCRAELCQQCPREGLWNSPGFNKGQMTALNGRPQRKMQSTRKGIEQELITMINILVK